MIKYRTSSSQATLIQEVQVVRETAHSVWLASGIGTTKPVCRPKRGSDTNYFDSWAEAKQYLVRWAADRVSAAERDLDRK